MFTCRSVPFNAIKKSVSIPCAHSDLHVRLTLSYWDARLPEKPSRKSRNALTCRSVSPSSFNTLVSILKAQIQVRVKMKGAVMSALFNTISSFMLLPLISSVHLLSSCTPSEDLGVLNL